MDYQKNQKVLEYVQKCNFKDKEFENEGDRDEAVAKVVFRDAIKGLENLHSLDFVHRDIKLDNILVTSKDGKAKLADFSVS